VVQDFSVKVAAVVKVVAVVMTTPSVKIKTQLRKSLIIGAALYIKN